MINLWLYHHLHAPYHLIQQLTIVKPYLLVQLLIIGWWNLQRLRLLPKQWCHSPCYLPEHPSLFFWLSLTQLQRELVPPIDQVLHVVYSVLLIGKMTHHEGLNVGFFLNTKYGMLGNQWGNQLVGFCKFGETLFFTELARLFWHQFKYLWKLRVTPWNIVIRVLDFCKNWLNTFKLREKVLFEVLGGFV
jgi:hypothetical protein